MILLILDTLDGMAATHWPHPEWTERLWFRKNIKVVESGLDMVLGIAALIYIIVRVDAIFGIVVLGFALVIGTVFDLIVYGRILGSEKRFKRSSMMARKPDEAETIIAIRFILYIIAVVGVMLRLLFVAITGWLPRVILIVASVSIAYVIVKKKLKDGRLDGVVKMLKKLLR